MSKPAINTVGLSRLRKVLQDADSLAVTDIDDWIERARLAVSAAYGVSSAELARFDQISYSPGYISATMAQDEWDDAARQGLKSARGMLSAFIEDLGAHEAESPEIRPVEVGGTDIFVVHGHDEALKSQVARLLERLKLNPIILHEQPNGGRTVIEKFEDHALKAGFAIALLTADDIGHAKGAPDANARARQNVILELGYFMGALGRERTVALIEGGVEKPSDLAGLVYVATTPGWELAVAKELKSAGIPVDLNDLA